MEMEELRIRPKLPRLVRLRPGVEDDSKGDHQHLQLRELHGPTYALELVRFAVAAAAREGRERQKTLVWETDIFWFLPRRQTQRVRTPSWFSRELRDRKTNTTEKRQRQADAPPVPPKPEAHENQHETRSSSSQPHDISVLDEGRTIGTCAFKNFALLGYIITNTRSTS